MTQERIALQRREEAGKVSGGAGAGIPETVRVRLLGGFGITVGDRDATEGLRRLRKAGALVKLLALARGHGLHRERAMDILWPDLDARAAANNLHRALHVARGALGGGSFRYLTLGSGLTELCPNSPLWVDVEVFEDAARLARRAHEPAPYRVALDLYAGDLLPGDGYEPWAEERREGLRRLHLTLLVELADLHERRGEYGAAVEALQRVVAEEPADEAASASLMRLHAANGRRHDALLRYERLRKTLSERLSARPTHALRRLRDQIRVGETPAPPLPSAPGVPAGTSKDNLPVSLTSFVGREEELARVGRSLAMTRLLTLTGAGGIGKTRLALEVGRRIAGVYPDGVWLAELGPLTDGGLVPRAVAAALGARERPECSLIRTISDHLGTGRALLVLDNCEHLVEAAAGLARDLLGACPNLKVLATSREVLGVPGETVWPLPPLSLPGAGDTVGALMGAEAVRLFVERARSRLPAFELTPRNAPAVADICRRLDGIPLAIELSTARMGTLAAEQVAERLAGSLGFLAGADRAAPPRHRTLRATLDWSYALLSEPERRLFARLSVFAGGWTLEAAEAVGAGTAIRGEDVPVLLSRLVDKSVVVVAEPSRDGGPRYGMLGPVRQDGLERLRESPEEEAAVRRRHAFWFFELAQEVEPWLGGGRQEAWLRRLENEYGNLRAALDWALERGETDLGLWFGGALAEFWYMSGDLGEARRWLETALAGGPPSPARTMALARAAWISWEQGDYGRSVAHSEEGLALSEGLGDGPGVAAALSNLAWASLLSGDLDRACDLAGEAVTRGRTLGDAGSTARALIVSGLAAVVRRDHDRATTLQRESLRLAREAEDGVAAALSLGMGVFAALGRGDLAGARQLCREAFEAAPRPTVMVVTAFHLHAAAALAAAQGRGERSAHLWGAAEALREYVGAALSPVERRAYKPYLDAARQGLDPTAWEEAWAEGQTMTAEEAIRYAVSESGRRGRSAQAPAAPRGGHPLSHREREVATLISRGLTNRQIAGELTISDRTVTTHVDHILHKLGATSRTQVAAWMVEQRISPAPDVR